MNKLLASMGLALTATAVTATSVVPASAQNMGSRDRIVANFCEAHPGNRDCWDWNHNGHRWDNNHYQSFYRNNQQSLPNVASGIFGFAAGAIIGGAIANQRAQANAGNVVVYDGHVARCEARFKSYDVRSDTYLGFDGLRHYCNL